MTKTATIFKHTHQDGSCYLGKLLGDWGFNVRSIGVPTADLDSFDPLESDLLLVMGGPVGVYQADHYPFIYKELELLGKRISSDKPTLGICLGAQLIAKALGAEVYLGKQGKEVGWHRLTLLEAARDHPVRHLCGSKTSMFHWHNDTFDLPEDATLLASSDMYKNQAFSYGSKILGLQCHTEIREARLPEWYVNLVADITGPNRFMDIEDLKRQSEEHVETLNKQTKKFFREWIENVGLA